MINITLKNGETASCEDVYSEMFKRGETIKDTDECLIPFHAIASICEAGEVATVGNAVVGSAVVG